MSLGRVGLALSLSKLHITSEIFCAEYFVSGCGFHLRITAGNALYQGATSVVPQCF